MSAVDVPERPMGLPHREGHKILGLLLKEGQGRGRAQEDHRAVSLQVSLIHTLTQYQVPNPVAADDGYDDAQHELGALQAHATIEICHLHLLKRQGFL